MFNVRNVKNNSFSLFPQNNISATLKSNIYATFKSIESKKSLFLRRYGPDVLKFVTLKL